MIAICNTTASRRVRALKLPLRSSNNLFNILTRCPSQSLLFRFFFFARLENEAQFATRLEAESSLLKSGGRPPASERTRLQGGMGGWVSGGGDLRGKSSLRRVQSVDGAERRRPPGKNRSASLYQDLLRNRRGNAECACHDTCATPPPHTPTHPHLRLFWLLEL